MVIKSTRVNLCKAMRIPSYEITPGALVTLLNTATQAYLVDLFTFVLSGGTIIRYTSADVSVTVNGATYLAGPVIRRGKTKLSVGIAVDTLDVTISCNSSVTINGVGLLQFIATGGFDGAKCMLDRGYSANPTTAFVGTLTLFKGRVSDTSTSRYQAQLTISSDSELLNAMVPRNVYQPGCNNTLFDGACGVVKSSYGVVATAAIISGATYDKTRIIFTNLIQPTGYFDLGFAICLTGANAGVSRTIKTYSNGFIYNIQPFPQIVQAGDTFTVYPGCDKTQLTCSSKFSNIIKFRGQPYIPAPETIA